MIQVAENAKKGSESSPGDELRILIGLQELDTELFRLKEKRTEIPRRIESLQSSLKKGKDILEAERSEYERLKKLKKGKDMVLDDGLERLKKLKARVSEIKTNKEYQAHIKEIETAQTENRGIEDEILSLMERIEDSYKLVEAEEKRYAEVGKRLEEDRREYEEEEKMIQGEITVLEDKRETVVSKIRQELYDNYSKILKVGKGIAVVPIKDGSCTGCHMSLPPQMINDVRKNEEINECSNCHRILYYKGLEGL